jgi:hypothetical protein
MSDTSFRIEESPRLSTHTRQWRRGLGPANRGGFENAWSLASHLGTASVFRKIALVPHGETRNVPAEWS